MGPLKPTVMILNHHGRLLMRKAWKGQVMLTNSVSYVARARLLDKIKNDDQFCQDQLGQALFLPFHKGKPLLKQGAGPGDHQPSLLEFQATNELNPEVRHSSVALGVNEDGVPLFATNIGTNSDSSEVEVSSGSKFTDLRVGLFLVSGTVAHTLSKAWSLLNWGRKTSFCSLCGKPLARSPSGCSSSCTSCSAVFYPTTSPVGIVSISDPSTDKLLLIRQPRYPVGMFSCVAGFLDVGETLEDCVRREVAEEVGLEVDSVSYSASQHWPFPAGSLMIGCHAEVLPGQTADPCKVELEDARWFSRQEVMEAKQRIDDNPHLRVGKGNSPDKLFLAPRGAIAYQLVSNWLERK